MRAAGGKGGDLWCCANSGRNRVQLYTLAVSCENSRGVLKTHSVFEDGKRIWSQHTPTNIAHEGGATSALVGLMPPRHISLCLISGGTQA